MTKKNKQFIFEPKIQELLSMIGKINTDIKSISNIEFDLKQKKTGLRYRKNCELLKKVHDELCILRPPINNIERAFLVKDYFNKRIKDKKFIVTKKYQLNKYLSALKYILATTFIEKNTNIYIPFNVIKLISRYCCILSQEKDLFLDPQLGSQYMFEVKYSNKKSYEVNHITIFNIKIGLQVLFSKKINRSLGIIYDTFCEYYCPTCHEESGEGCQCHVCKEDYKKIIFSEFLYEICDTFSLYGIKFRLGEAMKRVIDDEELYIQYRFLEKHIL